MSWKLGFMGLILMLPSCGMLGFGEDGAASKWWEENKVVVLNAAVGAATSYMEDGKEGVIEAAVTAANSYTDSKLAEKKQETINALLAEGFSISDMDADNDGVVSDAELAEFLKTNPMGLWYAGAGGGAFLLLYYARQKLRLKVEEEAE